MNCRGEDVHSTIDLCFSRFSNCKVTTTLVDLPFSDHKGLITKVGRSNFKLKPFKINKWRLTSDHVEHARDNPCILPDSGSDVDALAGGPGYAVDAGLRLARNLSSGWSVHAGARYLDGGADNDEVYAFADFTSVTLGVTWRSR